jgi:hypothetical protein
VDLLNRRLTVLLFIGFPGGNTDTLPAEYLDTAAVTLQDLTPGAATSWTLHVHLHRRQLIGRCSPQLNGADPGTVVADVPLKVRLSAELLVTSYVVRCVQLTVQEQVPIHSCLLVILRATAVTGNDHIELRLVTYLQNLADLLECRRNDPDVVVC